MAATYSPVPIAIGMVQYHRPAAAGLTSLFGKNYDNKKASQNKLKGFFNKYGSYLLSRPDSYRDGAVSSSRRCGINFSVR
jgi:hypothetical protein